ncbi:MAG: signal peptidase II [Geitlerinemataceae cyanobacterium]
MLLFRLRNPWFWSIALLGIALDRLTKIWVVSVFEMFESWPIVDGVFHFTYVTNTGAAFSLFAGSGWLKWLSLIVSLGLAYFGLTAKRLRRLEQIAYGAILSGAVGNGIDRFLRGEVVDFLDFRLIRFPIFNIADVAINIGIFCLVVIAIDPPQLKRFQDSDK